MPLRPIHVIFGFGAVGLLAWLSRVASGATSGADGTIAVSSPLPSFPQMNLDEAVVSTIDAGRGLNPAVARWGTARVYDGGSWLNILMMRPLHVTERVTRGDSDGTIGGKLVGWVDSSEPEAILGAPLAATVDAIRAFDPTQRGYLCVYRPTASLYALAYITDPRLVQAYAAVPPWAIADWKNAGDNA